MDVYEVNLETCGENTRLCLMNGDQVYGTFVFKQDDTVQFFKGLLPSTMNPLDETDVDYMEGLLEMVQTCKTTTCNELVELENVLQELVGEAQELADDEDDDWSGSSEGMSNGAMNDETASEYGDRAVDHEMYERGL